MIQKFCPMCGNGILASDEGHGRCQNCDYINYNNPLPVTVAVVAKPIIKRNIQTGISYLTVERGVEPQKGKLALPGGFMNTAESPEESVLRELKEETGLVGRVSRLLQVVNPLPGKLNQILLFYKIKVTDYSTLKAGDDAEEIKWFNALWNYGLNKNRRGRGEEIPFSYRDKFRAFAFDSHIDVIRKELLRHRKKTLSVEDNNDGYGSFPQKYENGRVSY